jgi:hypothetical protein
MRETQRVEPVSARALWDASRRAGDALRGSRDAAALRDVFDLERTSGPVSPHVTMAQHILAGLGGLRSRAMLLGLYLPRIPSIGPMPGYEDLARIEGGMQFIDSAARIASTLLVIVEHLRERLPGYPEIPVPDLCPGSPAVVNDAFVVFERLPWPASARAQRPARPSTDAASLALGPAATVIVEQIAAALEEHDAWREFVRLEQELTGPDREQLKRICDELADATTDAVVDERAGDILMQRAQYARAALEDAHTSATGLAGEYLASFRRVDRAINLAGGIISERVAYDAPVGLPEDAQVSWHRVEGTIEARALVPSNLFPFLYPGRLVVYSAGPPAGGAWFLNATSHHINFELGSTSTLTGDGLEDSDGVFDDLLPPELEEGVDEPPDG